VKRIVLLGAVLAGLALLVGTGCEKKEPGAKPEKKVFRIGLVAKSSTNPVFLAARVGAEAKAAELSKQYGIEVVIDWQTPPKEDAQVQADRIKQLVAGGVDAIILSCSDAKATCGAVNDAVDRGVPVMCFDSDAPESKRFAFHGVDDLETGKAVMKHLARQMGAKGVVAILAGNPNAPNLKKRVEGVREEAKNYPDITIKDVYYHAETPDDAAKLVKTVMDANQDITGWAMVGGWPLFTDALQTNWRAGVKVVAVDALPAQLAYVESGIAPVLLAQKVFDWGYRSVEMTFDKVYLRKDVPERDVATLEVVTKDNLGQWARKLEKWDFKVDPKYLQMK
jgi:ribose transport system substrate-binding protein